MFYELRVLRLKDENREGQWDAVVMHYDKCSVFGTRPVVVTKGQNLSAPACFNFEHLYFQSVSQHCATLNRCRTSLTTIFLKTQSRAINQIVFSVTKFHSLCSFNIHVCSSRWMHWFCPVPASLRVVMLSNGPSVRNWLCTALNGQVVGFSFFNSSHLREFRGSICVNKVSSNRPLAQEVGPWWLSHTSGHTFETTHEWVGVEPLRQWWSHHF